MKKVELFVTEKGHNAPNKWKQGKKISVHPDIAKQLIEKGFASEEVVKESKKADK